MEDTEFKRQIQSSLNKMEAARRQRERYQNAQNPQSKVIIPLKTDDQIRLERANADFGDILVKNLPPVAKLKKTY